MALLNAMFVAASAVVVLGGGATIAIALPWALLFPARRGIDRFPGLESAGARIPST